MAKKEVNRDKESSLVACAVSKGNMTTLITPSVEYVLFSGRVNSIKPVDNYIERIQEELDRLSQRIKTGFFSEEVRIQYFGISQDPDLS